MPKSERPLGQLTETESPRRPLTIGLGCAVLLIVLFCALFLHRGNLPPNEPALAPGLHSVQAETKPRATKEHWRPPGASRSTSNLSAEAVVAGKLSEFAHLRRSTLTAMAEHFKVAVPEDVQKFFDAAESGNREEQTNLYALLQKQRQSGTNADGLNILWGPIQDAFGVAEQARLWPAQKLLDYGNAILGSLRPGMIYVGGTDAGRFIPSLLNDTSKGERHIIFTQNGMADNSYLQYANFLYGDRLPALDGQDSQRAFEDYLRSARNRVLHDQQFPNEPPQVRPGEEIKFEENRLQVGGQVSVMAINERLLQRLMDKNPDASFAIEQSFPFVSTYATATPLGPIMELRVQDPARALTSESAAQSLEYWRNAAQQIAVDGENSDSLVTRQAWAKMAAEQAALLLDHKFTVEAEQGFQIATQINPGSPEVTFHYVDLLLQLDRVDDAIRVAQRGAAAAPENEQFRDLIQKLSSMQKK